MEKAAEPNKDTGAILSGGCKLSNAWQKIAHLRATLRIGQNLVDQHFSNPSLSLDSLVNPCHLSDSVVWILLIMVQMLQQPEGHQRILYRLNNGSCFPWDRMDEGSRANYCFSCLVLSLKLSREGNKNPYHHHGRHWRDSDDISRETRKVSDISENAWRRSRQSFLERSSRNSTLTSWLLIPLFYSSWDPGHGLTFLWPKPLKASTCVSSSLQMKIFLPAGVCILSLKLINSSLRICGHQEHSVLSLPTQNIARIRRKNKLLWPQGQSRKGEGLGTGGG